jgi:hypothetical protein
LCSGYTEFDWGIATPISDSNGDTQLNVRVWTFVVLAVPDVSWF